MHLSPLNLTTVIHFFTTYLNSLLTACSLFKMPLPELLYPLLNASITYLLLSKLYTWLPIRERIKFKIASLTFKTMLHNLLIFTTYLNIINLHDLFDLLIYIC